MQSLWQNAPHCLQIIIALTSQAKGFWVFRSEGEGGLGKSGTPYDFSIILLPPLCFIFGKIRLGSLLFVTTAFGGLGLTPLVCFSTTFPELGGNIISFEGCKICPGTLTHPARLALIDEFSVVDVVITDCSVVPGIISVVFGSTVSTSDML